MRMSANQLLEHGKSRGGYWTSDKFMKQIERAVDVAEVKYHKEEGYQLFWILIRAHTIQHIQ